jgi:hypothetical protein
MDEIIKRDVDLSIKKFRNYIDSLVNGDFETFESSFKILMYFCETDPIMQIVTSELQKNRPSVNEWLEQLDVDCHSSSSEKVFRLPFDEKERISLLYQICLDIYNKEENILGFSSKFFCDLDFDTLVKKFNHAIIKPLIDAFEIKLEEIEYDLEENTKNTPVPIPILVMYYDSRVNIGDNNSISGDVAIGNNSSIDKGE